MGKGVSTRNDPFSFAPTAMVGNSLGPANIGRADPHVPESTAQATCSPAGTGALREISILVPRDGSGIGDRVIEPYPLFGADRPSSEFTRFGLKLPVHTEGPAATALPVVRPAQAANTTTNMVGMNVRVENMNHTSLLVSARR